MRCSGIRGMIKEGYLGAGDAKRETEALINLENNPMTTYHYRMHQEDLQNNSADGTGCLTKNKKTVCLLGMRAEESSRGTADF